MRGGAEIVPETLSGNLLPARQEPEIVSTSVPTSFNTQQPRFFTCLTVIVFDYADQKRMSGGVFALVVVILAVSFIHGSYALNCYTCKSLLEEFCDDPFDETSSGVEKKPCPPNYKSCGKASGTAYQTGMNSI